MEPKTLTFCNQFGTHNLVVSVGSYANNGRLSVDLLCVEDEYLEPYTRLTVNLADQPVNAPNEAYIKTYGGNEGLLELILENGLGAQLTDVGRSGFSTYPKVAFDMEKLKEFDPEGVEKYTRQNA